MNSMVAGGLALAVPSNAVERFLHEDGKAPRLGVTLRSVSMPVDGTRILGLLVLGVEVGGAAEGAGIAIGDVLIGIGGQLLGGPHNPSRALRHPGVSGRLSIDLIRGGQPMVCDLTVAAAGLMALRRDTIESLLPVTPSAPHALPDASQQALTPREIEVLNMLAEGLANKTIAWRLGISEHTVKFHLSSIFTKLNASSRTEAVTLAIRQGLIMV
jgi:DNA-binding CsgD family transcriptional regulator